MDASSAAAIATVIITQLSPYLAKAGEGFASSVGKDLANRASKLIGTIFRKGQKPDTASELLRSLPELHGNPERQHALLEYATDRLSDDCELANQVNSQLDEIRIVVLECLRTRFLTPHLKEVYFRLGLGWDDLSGTGSSNREKAIALVEEMWAADKIERLLIAMSHVRPGLRC